jgi:hypothetical protein
VCRDVTFAKFGVLALFWLASVKKSSSSFEGCANYSDAPASFKPRLFFF